MSAWGWASWGLCLALLPCAIVCLRGTALNRLAGLEMGSIVLALLLVTLSEQMQRTSFLDLAVALALLSFGGGLVFARFLERWL